MTIADRNAAIAALMRTLVACRESGEVITVQSPFEDGPTRLVNILVIAVDVSAQKFLVKRDGDDFGKWFAIRHNYARSVLDLFPPNLCSSNMVQDVYS